MPFLTNSLHPSLLLVCWDTFDADAIWAQVPSRRPSAPLKPGEVPGERRRSYNSSTGGGRWQRGQALPPSEDRRKEKDASNPDDLWDDPIGGATGAATDFSAFGELPEGGAGGDAFDFDKMAEASRELEEELHGPSDVGGSGGNNNAATGAVELKVDEKRPLATGVCIFWCALSLSPLLSRYLLLFHFLRGALKPTKLKLKSSTLTIRLQLQPRLQS